VDELARVDYSSGNFSCKLALLLSCLHLPLNFSSPLFYNLLQFV
jgi:hypothetical protein